MAVVKAYQALNMLSTQVFYGVATRYDSSTIEITSGDTVARYSGNFTYDDWGNVYGQLTEYTLLVSGSVMGSVSNFRVDAYRFSQAIDREDVSAAYNMVLSGSDDFYGSERGDQLLGLSGNDVMRGNGGNDRLIAGNGWDKLYAGSGADILEGGRGKDQLYGGKDGLGDDFVFKSRHDSVVGSRDMIHNFTKGMDDIDLRGIDANSSTYKNEAFEWSGRTADEHSVWWKTSTSGVRVLADVTGDAKADVEILLVNVSAISSGDVLL
ncbi:calcium-binding protein [Rubellimicrobium roseum]|uniref:Peptidase M10 serralysin C-terminal domain-containing protein n=1 Tax=Rubellimicrobium roseum TaxID=687525 RepID=A0A5C4N6C5_9RHOB|nr:M10 family metallopeptidase C-terminal domain-containing protein [Rubellimicrobium roseum]TNC59858.1 hypothetical protein FHG71_22465 [Rubellimicrobium roseum]